MRHTTPVTEVQGTFDTWTGSHSTRNFRVSGRQKGDVGELAVSTRVTVSRPVSRYLVAEIIRVESPTQRSIK